MFLRQSFRQMTPLVLLFLLAGPSHAEPPVKEPVDAAAKIRKALRQPTEFKCDLTPLDELMRSLSTKHGIQIHFDKRALKGVGVTLDSPISRNVKGISLESALRLVLHDVDLAYWITDEVLLITTPEFLETRLETKVYPVRDLVSLPGEKTGDAGIEDLAKLIQGSICPVDWDRVGGPGSLADFSDVLVVSQTVAVHEEIEGLLLSLRALPPLGAAKCGEMTTPIPISREDPATKKIVHELGQKTSCRFDDMPLIDVAVFFKRRHNIDVQLDRHLLDDRGDPLVGSVTADIKDITLGSALRILLREYGLTFVVRNQMLLITDEERSEDYFRSVLFPVFDLLDLPATAGAWEVEHAMEKLIEVITSTAKINSWDVVGGRGGIVSYKNRAALVVMQNSEGLQAVNVVLTKLRQTRVKPGVSKQLSQEARYETVVYQYLATVKSPGKSAKGTEKEISPAIPPADLEAVIKKIVEPESWQQKRAYVKALPGRLVVRQTRQVLHHLEEFLVQLGLVAPAPKPASCFWD